MRDNPATDTGQGTQMSSGLTRQSIENLFRIHSPTGNQGERYEQLRTQARNLALLTFDVVPTSREQSEAITALQEFLMWSQLGILNESRQVGGASGG